MIRTLELYNRYHNINDEIDNKESELKPWQVNALHDLAGEAEKVLAGCRRKSERRT